jgi:hypothetical protein
LTAVRRSAVRVAASPDAATDVGVAIRFPLLTVVLTR